MSALISFQLVQAFLDELVVQQCFFGFHEALAVNKPTEWFVLLRTNQSCTSGFSLCVTHECRTGVRDQPKSGPMAATGTTDGCCCPGWNRRLPPWADVATSLARCPSCVKRKVAWAIRRDGKLKSDVDGSRRSTASMRSEVAAWQRRRGNLQAKVSWQLTTKDARVKLKRLYSTTFA